MQTVETISKYIKELKETSTKRPNVMKDIISYWNTKLDEKIEEKREQMLKARKRMDEYLKKVDIKEVENLKVDGVDKRDYPDFCDAFFCEGIIKGRELNSYELDFLTDKFPEVVNEMAFDSLI